MKATYDSEADAMYIHVGEAEVAETEVVDDTTVLDLDEDGTVIGIELLGISQRVSIPEEVDVERLGAETATI
ncbi:MAG: DUF2283 domain-containing protein [Candidatus Nanohaloarchaea archaeon]|nr:DUF2283 domain-containing protein [Candidatus Nanohaloarchaea archaeon]